MSDLVKVKAKKPGFVDGQYRAIGDVFEVDAEMFSDFWMDLADEPVQEQSQEAVAARAENAGAAPAEQFGSMSDEALAAYFETVMGEKPHHAAKRETLIAKITDKLNAD